MTTEPAVRNSAQALIEAANETAGVFEIRSRTRLDELQAARLRALVTHAREHAPFYAARLRGIDLDAPDLLHRLPTLDKESMIENLPEILTDRRLREVDLAAHVDGLAGDELLFNEYRVMASGGTSGVRGFYVYDREAWVVPGAAMAAGAILLGMGPREPKVRAATIWAAGSAHMTARMAMSFQPSTVERLSLSAMAPIAELVTELNEFHPDWLTGYPSILSLLAEEQEAGRLRIAPQAVMTTSEQCTQGMRARMSAAWGSEPFNTYASTEAGSIALECDHHGGMHIFEGRVILEIVDDQHRPVPDGEAGTKVLVTNLFNHTQPLIRFELTDMLTLAADPCPCGRASKRIISIDGRSDDIIRLPDADGTEVPVHPNHFAEAVESVAQVSAYQVIEAADGIDVAIVASGDVAEIVAARVRVNLAKLGVNHTPIHVHRVQAIPRPAGASGKFKLVHARVGRV